MRYGLLREWYNSCFWRQKSDITCTRRHDTQKDHCTVCLSWCITKPMQFTRDHFPFRASIITSRENKRFNTLQLRHLSLPDQLARPFQWFVSVFLVLPQLLKQDLKLDCERRNHTEWIIHFWGCADDVSLCWFYSLCLRGSVCKIRDNVVIVIVP